jgi:iron complex outermembrane receptor protein
MKNIIQLSLLSVALLSQLSAQEIVLKSLQVTSTAIKTDELRAANAVEVYTQKDIEEAHVQNVYEFLNKNTSVFSTSGYGNPFLQKIDMRGFGVGDGYQNIVITINGRKMNNVDMVPQLLASISPSSIKKLEIIKSSGIVVAGDGANAGVINITTKQGNDKEVSFYLGSYGLADGAFYVGHKGEKLSINVSGEAQKNDGTRDINAKKDKDANKFSTGSFNLSYEVTEDFKLHTGVIATRTNVIYAGSLTQEEYDKDPTVAGASNYGSTHQKYKSDVITAGLNYNINDELSIKADVSNENKESNYITYNSVTDYRYKTATLTLDYITEELALKAGIDIFDGDVDKTNLTLTKANQAVFLMSEFYISDFTLKAGYRYEVVDFKSNVAENKEDKLNGVELGVNYLVNKESSLFADYTHSYQTASLDRLFSYSTGAFTGYVEPSQANNYNIGYTNIQADNKLKVSLFYIDLKNEIYYYSDPTYVNSQNTNIDKSHKYGLDFYDKYIINKEFNLALNYSYIQAIINEELQNGDEYTGNTLPGVSDHNAKATFAYLPNEFATLSLTQIYRSEAYAANDFNNNFEQKQEAYYTTDISVTYAKDNWEVFAKINNLFDQSNGLWIRDDAIYPVNFTRTALAGFKLKY